MLGLFFNPCDFTTFLLMNINAMSIFFMAAVDV